MNPLIVNYEATPFLQTSNTASWAHRLNWRCEMLLTRNAEAIRNKRILDLASHDGRFSYACLRLGAKHVTGIEGRPRLNEIAKKNLQVLGYNSESFSFLQGDIFEFLPKFNSGDFDTILCFGFFYHTFKQVELLSGIKRLHPQYFILDTAIHYENYIVKSLNVLLNFMSFNGLFRLIRRFQRKPANLKNLEGIKEITKLSKKRLVSSALYKLVFVPEEHHRGEGRTIDPSDWVAMPTKPLVELLLRLQGFNFHQINWKEANIPSWATLEDYKCGKRISYVAQLEQQAVE